MIKVTQENNEIIFFIDREGSNELLLFFQKLKYESVPKVYKNEQLIFSLNNSINAVYSYINNTYNRIVLSDNDLNRICHFLSSYSGGGFVNISHIDIELFDSKFKKELRTLIVRVSDYKVISVDNKKFKDMLDNW